MLLRRARTVLRGARRVSSQSKPFYILGIETSCDDTACAVVSSDKQILSDVRQSQEATHTLLGGVIPTVARDLHAKHIQEIANEAIKQSGLTIGDLSAIAVTVTPGLWLSLRVGVNFAVELSKKSNLPLIPVHHMEAHALTARLTDNVDFPFLLLLASGGHCLLAIADSINNYRLIGRSLDISPGETLDKIARRLRLRNEQALASMGGGRQIEECAKRYEEYIRSRKLVKTRDEQASAGDPLELDPEVLQQRLFPVASRPLARTGGCMFSFGGILSSFRRFIGEQEEEQGVEGDAPLRNRDAVCYAAQYTIVKHLLTRIQRGMALCNAKQTEAIQQPVCVKSDVSFERDGNLDSQSPKGSLVLSGGVGSNLFLRRCLDTLCRSNSYRLVSPPPRLCTDNGVMIAWNGVEKWMSIGPSCSVPPEQAESILSLVKPKAPFGTDLCDTVCRSKIRVPQLRLPKLVSATQLNSDVKIQTSVS